MQLRIAATGAVPALLAMLYVDRLDAKRPEPRWTLRKVAIWGAVSVLPCILVELAIERAGRGLPPYAAAVFRAFVMAAAVEELAKVLCLRWTVWRMPEFDERLDGIVYATRAGLGFALVENVMYLAGTKTLAAFVTMFVARAILSVPMHAIAAGIMGYLAARRRFDGRGIGFVGGYVIAVLLHGTFDAGLFVAEVAAKDHHAGPGVVVAALAAPLLVVLVGGVSLRRMARRALADDDRAAVPAKAA